MFDIYTLAYNTMYSTRCRLSTLSRGITAVSYSVTFSKILYKRAQPHTKPRGEGVWRRGLKPPLAQGPPGRWIRTKPMRNYWVLPILVPKQSSASKKLSMAVKMHQTLRSERHISEIFWGQSPHTGRCLTPLPYTPPHTSDTPTIKSPGSHQGPAPCKIHTAHITMLLN